MPKGTAVRGAPNGSALDWRVMRTTWNGSAELRAREHPRRARPRDEARGAPIGHLLSPASQGVPAPIKQKRWCPRKHDREVTPEQARQGLEAGRGRFVVVEEGEGRWRTGAPRRLPHDRHRAVRPFRRRRPRVMDRTYFLVPGSKRSAGPTSSCWRRWRSVTSVRSDGSSAPAVNRSASSGRGARAGARDGCTSSRTSTPRPRSRRRGGDRRQARRAGARAADRPGPRRRVRPPS